MFAKWKERKEKIAWNVKKVHELEAIMDVEEPTSDRYKAAQASRAELIKEINGRDGNSSSIKDSLILEGVRVIGGATLMVVGTAIESVGFMVPTRSINNLLQTKRFTDIK